jgi:dTDP-4-amino-4,6-dideoxygalactose transaminase
MKIPQIDIKQQTLQIKEELLKEFEAVLDSGNFILGPYVESFEQRVSDFLSVKHAIGCNSGTDALVLALLAKNIGPGDEVITSAFSFFASGSAIARVGATPVFVDIDEDRYTLRPEAVSKVLSNKTKAIIPVHMFGQMADMDSLQEIAEPHNISIIEDAAQSIGASMERSYGWQYW